MEKRQVNPWSWQDRFGYSQAWRVDGAESTVYLAGQGPISADGELVGEGDFAAQVRETFANIRTVLEHADASLDAVVKLNVYLTDIGSCASTAGSARRSCPGLRPRARPFRSVRSPCPG
ncbi:MAG TPA: RidA family protein [Gaiellaceae bacterium]